MPSAGRREPVRHPTPPRLSGPRGRLGDGACRRETTGTSIMELTEQHRNLLKAAMDRDDGLLPRPEKLVGAALRRMADRLLAGGVAETALAGKGEPYWFRGAEEGPTGLRITEAGRTLVSGLAGAVDVAPERLETMSAVSIGARARAMTHRRGTKRALLVELLRREGGATLDVLADALGWQPHTVRAALTRLRQDGVTIDRLPGEGGTAYRATDDTARVTQVDPGADA